MAQVALPFAFADLPRDEWHVTGAPLPDAAEGAWRFGPRCLLNGIELTRVDQALPPNRREGGPVVLAPASYAFVVVRDAAWGACAEEEF